MRSAEEQLRPFRVLSLDGGGMRGLYSARVLQRLACLIRGTRECDLDIGRGFDLIVGTSTGGILAAALAAGINVDEVVNLYRKQGPEIFSDSQPPPPTGIALPTWKSGCLMLPFNLFKLGVWICTQLHSVIRHPFIQWCVRNRNKAANNAGVLKEAFQRIFDNETMQELYERRKVGLCLTSVKISNEKFCVFKTPHRPDLSRDLFLTIVDACMATSAAPIYLPLAGISFGDSSGSIEVYADGGLAANNPVLVGLTEALSMVGDETREIHILSLGTCSAPEGEVLQGDQLNRGLLDWQVGAKALGLSMNAQASAAQETAKLLANWFTRNGKTVRLVRFPEVPRSPHNIEHLRKMDSARDDTIQALMTFAEEDAVEAFRISKECSDQARVINEAFAAMNQLETKKEKPE